MRLLILLVLCSATSLQAQDPAAPTDTIQIAADTTAPKARRGAELLIPVGSFLLPGLGQYVHGETTSGLGFTATTLAGYALSATGDAWGDSWDGDFPRRKEDQLAELAIGISFTSASLSAYQSFHAAVPSLQRRGKYEFLQKRETVGELLAAPFDTRFLRRWTTWVDLAQTAAVTALIIFDDGSGRNVAFRGHDIGYSAVSSMNAAVAEEALFRGWMLPALYQNTGKKFWLANGLQAGAFGAAHLPDAGWYAAVIGGWAAWEGWVVKRNGWSVRESIFHHFWYDAAIITAAMMTENRAPNMRLTFPSISF